MAAAARSSPASTLEHAQTVATLRVDEEVDAVFACTRKERQISRAGTPYLTVELRDSTGAILARAFREADVLAGRFERGQLVRVRGRVQRFRDELQIELARSSARTPARPTTHASCPPHIAIATSSKASSSTSRARYTTPQCRRC